MQSASESVGQGVPRVPRVKPCKIRVTPEKTPVSMLADEGDWTSTPDVAGLINNPDACTPVGQEVMVFDLSKPEDLQKYNEVLTNAYSPKANIFVLNEEVKFGEKTETFKVYLKIQRMKFKKLFKKGGKPDKFEEQEAALKEIL
jgi:hypothetical protein